MFVNHVLYVNSLYSNVLGIHNVLKYHREWYRIMFKKSQCIRNSCTSNRRSYYGLEQKHIFLSSKTGSLRLGQRTDIDAQGCPVRSRLFSSSCCMVHTGSFNCHACSFMLQMVAVHLGPITSCWLSRN